MRLSVPATPVVLVPVILLTHLYFLLVDGATFWIDMIAYVNLGECIVSAEKMTSFYRDTGRWFYSHLQPGLPVIWFILKWFPDYLQWPILAALQHGMAAYALYYAFLTVNEYWPTRMHIIFCTLICTLPFYQAFHNSFMTESIASSILIFAFAFWIRLIKEDGNAAYLHHRVMVCLLLIGQFRSYLSLVVFALALMALNIRRELFSKYIVKYLAVGFIAMSIFPAYRYLLTGEFFFPSAGLNKLMAGLWVNLSPSEPVQHQVIQSRAFEGMNMESIVRRGLDYSEALDLAASWQRNRLDNEKINALAERLGAILSNDHVVTFEKRVLMALASSGLILPYCLTSISVEVFPGMNPRAMCKHQLEHYAYLGWIDSPWHKKVMELFFVDPNAFDNMQGWKESKRKIVSMLKPYIYERPINLRDPLFIGQLPPDVWILLWFFAMGALLFRERSIGYGLLLILLGNLLVAFYLPVGNVRYSYTLFPICFLGLSIFSGFTKRWICEKRKTVHEQQSS